MACRSGEKLKLNKNKMIYFPLITNKEKQAFTLIEMIVSLGIIMIISVIFIANYNTSNKRTDLIMTAQSLVADIHAAQNNSLGLVRYGDEVPASGWGVNFNKTNNTYTIFADTDVPNSYGYRVYTSSKGDTAFGARQVIISGGLEIEEIKIVLPDSSIRDADNLSITFLPPDPKTNIFDQANRAVGNSVTIKLKEVGTNSFKTIRVNFLGLVEIID